MPFPNLKPTSRVFSPGDFPIKTYKSQSGVETRILYGSSRTGGELTLSYENISNAAAHEFTTHYDETKGTYGTFTLPNNTFAGSSRTYIKPGPNNAYRYAEPPQTTNVKDGFSTVQVKLVAVL